MKITLLVAAAFSLSSTLAADSSNGAITALASGSPLALRQRCRQALRRQVKAKSREVIRASQKPRGGRPHCEEPSLQHYDRGRAALRSKALCRRTTDIQPKKLHQYCKGARRFRRCFSNRQGIPRDCRTEDGERQLSTHPNRARHRSRMGCLGLRQIQPLYWRRQDFREVRRCHFIKEGGTSQPLMGPRRGIVTRRDEQLDMTQEPGNPSPV